MPETPALGRERQDAGHLQLYSEHKASLGYKRTPQKKKRKPSVSKTKSAEIEDVFVKPICNFMLTIFMQLINT